MGNWNWKEVNKYNSSSGGYICSYDNIQQAADDIGVNESTVRKQVNVKDVSYIKEYLYSLRKCENILDGTEYVEQVDFPSSERVPLPHKANILVIDIETAPTEAFVWGLWKQNVGINQIIEDSYILSYACKWLLEPTTYSSSLTTQEAIMKDDSRLIRELWRWLDSADIIIAHNGVQFDVKVMNTRFIYNQMTPTSSYQTIDTLDACKRNFRFVSNKLDYVTRYLGLSGKTEHEGFEMWVKCIRGDEEALANMEKYNRNDVTILEDLYMLLRPWIRPHPNMGLFVEGEVKVCPTCASSDITANGYYTTPMNKYEEFHCNSCGASGRSRFAEPKFKHLIASISH